MNRPSSRPLPGFTRSRRAVWPVIALLVAGVVWAVWVAPGKIVGPWSRTSAGSPRSRDAYAGSPYKNVRPGVEYVGDAACARCHKEIAQAYRSHPMGRSLAPVGAAGEGAPISADAGLPIELNGVRYTVERRAEGTWHKATRRGADPSVVAETEAEVRYTLGSGTRGMAFLIEHEGSLFQSPISWYALPSPLGHLSRVQGARC